MRVCILAAGMAVLALPALAGAAGCVFERNCYTFGESCRDAQIVVNLQWDDETGRGVMVTPGPRPFDITLREDPVGGMLSAVTDAERNATHLLTIFPDGLGLFSSHSQLPDLPILLSSIGTCEVAL